MKYKLKLSDGRVLSDLDLSGNTFVTDEDITGDYFTGMLERVDIEAIPEPEDEPRPDDMPEEQPNELVGHHERMRLTNLFKIGKRTGFNLEDIEPVSPTSAEGLRADVDYLLMMQEG